MTTNQNDACPFTIKRVSDGKIQLNIDYSVNGFPVNYGNHYYVRASGDDPRCFYLDDTNSPGNETYFTLAKVDPTFEENTARKVSAEDWNASVNNSGRWNELDTVIIYRRVIKGDGSEALFALATDGTYVPVYDGGDTLYYHIPENKDLNWHIISGSNGYYVSNLTDTVYISPSITAHTTTSDDPTYLTMLGMGNSYGTTIEQWDQGVYSYVGLNLDENSINWNNDIYAQFGLSATPGKDADSDTFMFAVVETLIADGDVHTVETVDSTSLGITMKMFNYDGPTYNLNYSPLCVEYG